MRELTKWLNQKRTLLAAFCLLCAAGHLPAQTTQPLTLEEAYQLSRSNYPAIRQLDLVAKTSGINIDNLRKGYLPQISFLAQASYQSAVTEIKVPVPGFSVDPLSKDQYKIVADINQVIYDGGVIREQKNQQELNAKVEQQKIEVDLFKIRERINQLFLGTLYLDEQLKQVGLVREDLQNGIRKVEAQVANGVAFRSNLDLLQAELLKTDQRAIEIRSTRTGFMQALGLFIHQSLPADQPLSMPESISLSADNNIVRPELQLLNAQDQLLGSQVKLIQSKNIPRASLFAQGGYAKPGLNFLRNQFDFYYIGGIRLSWNIGGLYTSKKDRQLVDINRQIVGIQKETFLLNTNAALVQQQAEIDKLQQLIQSDAAIIQLRVRVKDAAKAQLENGVITANDYLREVNAEDQARQSQIAHQIQFLQAKINYKYILGNQ